MSLKQRKSRLSTRREKGGWKHFYFDNRLSLWPKNGDPIGPRWDIHHLSFEDYKKEVLNSPHPSSFCKPKEGEVNAFDPYEDVIPVSSLGVDRNLYPD
jgi:hypothetical protein